MARAARNRVKYLPQMFSKVIGDRFSLRRVRESISELPAPLLALGDVPHVDASGLLDTGLDQEEYDSDSEGYCSDEINILDATHEVVEELLYDSHTVPR